MTMQNHMTQNCTKRMPAASSTYPKVASKCKYEHLCFKQTLVRKASLVFQIATFG